MRNHSFVAGAPGWACLLAIGLFAGAEARSDSAFVQQVQANFPAWDLNKDGKLTVEEIDKAVANPKVKGPAAAAAAALRRAAHSKSRELPVVTLANLPQLDAQKESKTLSLESMYTSALERIGKTNRELFGGGPPDLSKLHQGRLGDCFCLAPMGALINRDPKQVMQMFTLGTDGTCTVNFGGKNSVKVTMPTDAEVAVMANTGGDGVWLNVYEKAIGLSRSKPGDDPANAINVVSKGGSAGTMVAFVTGHEIERFSCTPWRDTKVSEAERKQKLEELRGKLVATQQKRRLICGGTGGGIKVPGIVGNHAYAILNYDVRSDLITLWNPQGNTFHPKGAPGLTTGYETVSGRFTLPLPELVTFFGGFSFEQDK